MMRSRNLIPGVRGAAAAPGMEAGPVCRALRKPLRGRQHYGREGNGFARCLIGPPAIPQPGSALHIDAVSP